MRGEVRNDQLRCSMVFQVFDRVKVKAGTRVFSNERPLGRIVTQPYEVQVHRVLTQDQSPDGYGAVVAWRSPGKLRDADQDWAEADGVTLVESRRYP